MLVLLLEVLLAQSLGFRDTPPPMLQIFLYEVADLWPHSLTEPNHQWGLFFRFSQAGLSPPCFSGPQKWPHWRLEINSPASSRADAEDARGTGSFCAQSRHWGRPDFLCSMRLFKHAGIACHFLGIFDLMAPVHKSPRNFMAAHMLPMKSYFFLNSKCIFFISFYPRFSD